MFVARVDLGASQEGLAAGCLLVFVTTKEHGEGPHKTCVASCSPGHPTNRTPDLIRIAVRLLEGCYEDRDWRRRPYRYRKAGVMLMELVAAELEQGQLFVAPSLEQARRMEAMDEVNDGSGAAPLSTARWGCRSGWRPSRTRGASVRRGEMRREHMSPRYTTRWDEPAEVRV